MIVILMNLFACDGFVQSCNTMHSPDRLDLKITQDGSWAGEVALAISGDGAEIVCTLPEGEVVASCDDFESSVELVGDGAGGGLVGTPSRAGDPLGADRSC